MLYPNSFIQSTFAQHTLQKMAYLEDFCQKDEKNIKYIYSISILYGD